MGAPAGSARPIGTPPRRLELWAATAVIVLGAWVRFYQLGATSLWIDEAFTWSVVTMPWPAMRHLVGTRELRLALYYLLLRAWVAAFGTSEAGLRSLSALFSIATISIVYGAGKRMFGPAGGLLAALLFALSPLSIVYARDARSYPLATMLVAASLLFFLRTLERPTLGNLAGWIAASAFAALAHLLAITAVAAELLPVLFLDRKTVPWRRLLLGAFLIGALSAPYALQVRHIDQGQQSWLPSTDWSVVAESLYGIANGLYYNHASGPTIVALISFGALIGVWALGGAWNESAAAAMPFAIAASGVVTPFVIIVALSFLQPILYYRYLMFTLPSLCLFVAGGITAARSRAFKVLTIMALVAGSGWHTWFMLERFRVCDWRSPAAYILARAQSKDALVVRFFMNRPPLDYYFARMGAHFEFAFPDYGPDLFIDGRYPYDLNQQEFMAKRLLTQIHSAAADGRRLWFVSDGETMGIFDRWAPLDITTQRLAEDYGTVSDQWVDGFHIYAASHPLAAAARLRLDEARLMKAGLDALYAKHNPLAAASDFRAILQQNPSHYGATFQLARALDLAGEPAAAQAWWKKMLPMAEAARDDATVRTVQMRLQSNP